jgi:sensor histidine kinase YesM
MLLVKMTFTPLLYYLLGGVLTGWLLLEFVIWRTSSLAKRKKEILNMQLEYARLEDKALRSQMNPHFIFNSLNSIKLLVQENKNEKAVYYLTTFTKLLRGMLNNADKSTITLHEELETCKLYLSLESLRFNDEFSYSINTDPLLDLKSIEIPALILQPFVENAIWHGLMPKKGDRLVDISVTQFQDWVTCRIDDNGIGRKAASQESMAHNHKSKGLELTHNRMHINDKLNETESRVIIHDKYSADGEPLGTRVDIMFDLTE